MDEYRALEALEDQCMPHTDPDSDEFSFKQQELHATFVRLLESYVEAYIRSLGRTLADFYEALRELKDGSGAPMLDASDCLDTLYEMEDIRCWIDGVKARVRQVDRPLIVSSTEYYSEKLWSNKHQSWNKCRVHLRALRTQAATKMLTSSTVPIAAPAMMPAKVLSARSTS